MGKPVSRPNRRLAQIKKDRYVNTGEASEMLDGMISAGILREMALAGEIRGAVQVRHRVFIPRSVVPTLVRELEFDGPGPKMLRPRTTSTPTSATSAAS